jgi:hypothetical protein
MKSSEKAIIREWFSDYIKGFYGIDDFCDANFHLKEEHSKRVCVEMGYLTGQLGLDENDGSLAEMIALLHDVGRFEQFRRYRTYHDPKSVNHSDLGVEVLDDAGILNGLDVDEREIIRSAIRYHGIKEVPAVDERTELFCKLIRDADKIDIYFVVTDYYRQYRENPDEFKLEIELPDSSGYSMSIVETVLRAERVDYNYLTNWNDMKILQLGWVYDINFVASLRRIRERGFLEKVAEFLPSDENINRVLETVIGYAEKRIANA